MFQREVLHRSCAIRGRLGWFRSTTVPPDTSTAWCIRVYTSEIKGARRLRSGPGRGEWRRALFRVPPCASAPQHRVVLRRYRSCVAQYNAVLRQPWHFPPKEQERYSSIKGSSPFIIVARSKPGAASTISCPTQCRSTTTPRVLRCPHGSSLPRWAIATRHAVL